MECFKNSINTKNPKNNQSGITLIVLVITIVVLIILAGITISNITGGDGIMNQASQRKDEATISKEKDILANAVITASNKTKLGDLTESNLREALSNKNVDIVKSGGLYRITFKDTNNLYKMNHDGEFFYWEDIEPTDIFWRFDTTSQILYLRATPTDSNGNTYNEGMTWGSSCASDIEKVIIEEPIAPTTCASMFSNCSNLKNIEQFENLHTENATSMMDMFYKCKSLKSLDLKYFDTSKVTMMYRMFGLCSKIESINVISFDTTNVTAMTEMFNGCYVLKNLDVSNFDTSKQKNMYVMFGACWELKRLDLSNFDLSEVTNLNIAISTMNELTSIKTPKKHPNNQALSIELPKTFYDQYGNSYNAITSTTPTQTWLTAR